MSTLYDQLMRVLGTGFTVASLAIATMMGVGRDGLALMGLGFSAGWLRFRLAPAGRMSLAPISFFFALLIVGPWVAFVVAIVVALTTAMFFGRFRFPEVLSVVGEEGVPSLLAATLVALTGSSRAAPAESTWIYVASLVVYVLVRIVVGSIGAHAREGVTPRVYLSGATKNNALNLLFLGLVAFGLKLYLFDQFGYFAAALVTIALVEFYHPWKLLSEQDEVLFSSLALVAQAIDIKDPYTARHSKNVARIAVRVARHLGLSEDEVRRIRIGALMHDIGKIGVSTAIIRKPSKLDPQEQEIMRAHPMTSADIMQPIELLAEASEIVRHHHEHIDGTGYPSGWKAERIPIGARVILVADAFDAMTTDRTYRRGRSKQEAIGVLKKFSGVQFDPDVVRALESAIDYL